MKQQFIKEKADTIRLTVFSNNRPVVPSAATIILYKPGGGDLQTEVAVTAIGSDGEMTYSLTSTHTATKDLNYKATWKYTVSGTDYFEDMLFDVVLSVLSIPVVDDDLYDELNSLRKAQVQDTAIATGGAAGTLIDTVERKEADDFWNGGTVEIISGTNKNEIRDVTDFVQSTGVISVSPNWTASPDTTSRYRVIRSWTNQISRGFEKLETMLLNKGRRHSLILESSEIKIPLIYLVVHFIALDIMNEPDDKWARIADKYWDLFNDSFGAMKLQYDEDESGNITDDEEGFESTAVTIGRA